MRGFAGKHPILSLKAAELGSADLDAEVTSIGEDAVWSPAATELDGSRGPIRATDATAAAPAQAGQSGAHAGAPGGPGCQQGSQSAP